ncbi:hypothetical protein KDD93_06780 [Campylobacter sp. faydin G-24]|uniref:Lipoprotein n=1 Tax=Campylobacter anatolicus TaxID=2829105 RepID=A0ABS5HJ17_9BACT|nr:hypothetical protein [Campylobacter anatolicus]MBR8464264.1 hypothetical protein [Campylobacter anatolicus]
MFILALLYISVFAGCADKKVLTRTEWQKVYIPIKCEVDIPTKPKYTPSDLQSAKELAKYYEEVENLLKGCVNE